MKINIDGVNYWITFEHNRKYKADYVNGQYRWKLSNFGGSTLCFLETEGFNKIAAGLCTVYHKDRYIKEIGRNLSFERMLQELNRSDEFKLELKRVFLNRKNNEQGSN